MNQKKYEKTLAKLVIEQMRFDFNQNENFGVDFGDDLGDLEKMLQSIIKEGNEKNLIAYVSTEYPEEFKRDMKSRKDWFVEGVIKK